MEDTAQAIETFQNMAVKKDYAFQISTSLPNSYELKIDKASLRFIEIVDYIQALLLDLYKNYAKYGGI